MKSIFNNNKLDRMKQETHMYSDNEVPYISTYHIQGKIKSNEQAVIEYYATDWEQSEYFNDKIVPLTLIYGIDGVEYTQSINAGDNSITLPLLDVGEHIISLQVQDEYGRVSHVLWNEILVVDKDYVPNYYTMTENDLIIYNINNTNSEDGTDLQNTHDGLNQIWSDKAKNYDGIIMLPGIYRIKQVGYFETTPAAGRHDSTYALKIPSNFTIDLNGSTIKQHLYEGQCSIMVAFIDCSDGHLINGTLDGDYDYHVTADGNGEHCYCVDFQGLCKYCSLENLTITNTVGYTTISQSILVGMSSGAHDLIDGDIVNGELVPHRERRSSNTFLDISNIISKSKWIRGSIYLGYSGVVSKSWIFDFHFYDENKNFIKTVRSFQFRKCHIPEGTKYCKLTFHDNTLADYDRLSVYEYNNPRNCEIVNVKYEHTRTCGIATTQTDNLYVKDCEFVDCAVSITPVPIDMEDGWFGTLDTTFDNINIHDCINNTALICSGHNSIFQNCNGEQMQFTFRGGWNASRSGVVRNCNVGLVQNNCDKHLVQAYSRVADSTVKNGLIPQYGNSSIKDRRWIGAKNCSFSDIGTDGDHVVYMNCILDGNNNGSLQCGSPLVLKNCTIKNYDDTVGGGTHYIRNIIALNCIVSNINMRNMDNLWFEYCTIDNFKVLYYSHYGKIKFINNIITNLCYQTLYYLGNKADLIFKDNRINNTDLYLVDISTTSLNSITLDNNIITTNTNILYGNHYDYTNSYTDLTIDIMNNNFITDVSEVIGSSARANKLANDDILVINGMNNIYSNDTTRFTSVNLDNNEHIIINDNDGKNVTNK